MRVEDLLRDSARRLPGKTAIVAAKRRLSFAALDVLSDRLAAALARRGIGRNDRVVVFMENSFEAIVAMLAVLKAGAAISPVGPSTKSDRLAFVVNDCRAAGVITQARLAATTGAAVALGDSLKLVVLAGAGSVPAASGCLSFEAAIPTTGDAPIEREIVSDPAMIVYAPDVGDGKSAAITHEAIVAAVASITTRFGSREDEVILSVLPLSSQQGFYQALIALKTGATLVVERSSIIPAMILYRIAEEKVTGLSLAPAAAASLLQLKDLRLDRAPHLRYIASAGGQLAPADVAGLRELFPSAKLHSIEDPSAHPRPAESVREPGLATPEAVGRRAGGRDDLAAPGEVEYRDGLPPTTGRIGRRAIEAKRLEPTP